MTGYSQKLSKLAFVLCAPLIMFIGVSSMQAGEPPPAPNMVKDPAGVAPNRFVYYPGTEPLSKKEVRVVACGTGMPDQRLSQASSCWLFEFGNGQKLIFDLGTGSMRNLTGMLIPYQFLDKVFLSHLHTDHWGDLGALWAGGWTSGRPGKLRVWGPSGMTEDMGTKYAVEHFLKANNWDYQTRAYKITPVPGQIETNEFDYKAVNKVIYDENGVVVRSIPAIHAGDGPVSFIVEYEGMKLVFGGDTTPNKWFAEHAQGADFVIHEAFANPAEYVRAMNQPPQLSWRMCCEFHTSGQSFGKIMSHIKPRHAVAYHHQRELAPSVLAGIRETYDGPVSMAVDLMVWNITPDKVTERMAAISPDANSVPGPSRQPPPTEGLPSPMSKFIADGEWGPGFNAQNRMLDEYSKKFGLEGVDWRKDRPWYKPKQ